MKTLLEPRTILFVDTETTGTGSDAHIVQLAWIFAGKAQNRLIKPDDWTIPAEATAIHGITTEHALQHGQDAAAVFQELHLAITRCEAIVAHNASFDMRMIKQEFDRLQLVMPVKRQICTMLGSMHYVGLPGKYGNQPKWPKLQELHMKLFGYEFADAHDALVDIRATQLCYTELRRLGVMPSEY